MTYQHLEVRTIDESIAQLIINRPPVNALNDQLANELTHVLRALEKNSNVKVILVCSAVKVFIAGADIAMMKELNETKDINHMLDFDRRLQTANCLLEEMSKPTIAVINGHAMGGGFELALSCDFRFISDNAKVGLPEIKLGLLPGAGGIQKIVQIIGYSKALRFMLEGKYISAEEALELGLVEQVCSEDRIYETVTAFAKEMVELPAKAVAEIKHCANMALYQNRQTSLKYDWDGLWNLFETDDARKGLTSFLNK